MKSMNCNSILSHRVSDVVKKLEEETGLPVGARLLGSAATLSKDFIGDIDVAITEDENELVSDWIQNKGYDHLQHGKTTSVAYPCDDSGERCQIDFMKADSIEAAKLFYHAPKHSKYSGEYRTIMAMIVFGCINKVSVTRIGWSDKGPDEVPPGHAFMTWKFSPSVGLQRVTRIRKLKKGTTDVWLKSTEDRPFLDPMTDMVKIYDKTGIFADSFESLFWTTMIKYPHVMDEVEEKFMSRSEVVDEPIEFKWRRTSTWNT